MAQIPTRVTALLDELTTHLPAILGRNLVGAYLHGSVMHKAFNPKRSDLDLIVVTQRDLSEAQFGKLDTWLAQVGKVNPWTSRLQILFLVKNELLVLNSSGCLYQFGILRRSGSDGNPIIWLDFLRDGKVLYGPRPESFLPEITPEIFLQALNRELGYLRQEISEKANSKWRDVPMYRAYAVLTVCRILYSFSNGVVASKPTAAKWAMKNLPEQWRDIISEAIEFNENGRVSDIPLNRIEQFIEFAHSQLQ